ncbi:hypothetical protein [Pseudoxanthomonas sacheonensis]|uniref:hypothetical protein n=1 Tax=Pseudoxanthomonas sacheonensis TaxID=443615 RepID=UPI0013D5E7C5|nr:hypothetical protein [Pseudoxanthomonas sacheonensis]KAF1708218.1 hypothetical protein CSC73_09810 [Pseudoxanthomonas sacheonensis]
MRNRSSNKSLLGASLYACACLSVAQTPAGKPATVAAPPIAVPPPVASAGADALADALTCRISYERYPGLMQEIRDEREEDFRQAYRQHSQPMLDVYRLEEPISAWGNESDVIVIAPNRVMMAVQGSLDAVTAQLEHALEQSSESPLSGALDDQHALVIFNADAPGLEGMVLLGCEYRIPDISLLEDPADAWRKHPVVPALPAKP